MYTVLRVKILVTISSACAVLCLVDQLYSSLFNGKD